MGGMDLAMAINWAPGACLAAAVACGLRSAVRGLKSEVVVASSLVLTPTLSWIVLGLLLGSGLPTLIQAWGLNPGQLSMGEFVQKELAEKPKLARQSGEARLSKPASQDASIREQAGAARNGAEGTGNRQTESRSLVAADANPAVDMLKNPNEMRSAADAQALWEVAIGAAVAFAAAAAAWGASRRWKRSASGAGSKILLPEVLFPTIDQGSQDVFRGPKEFGAKNLSSKIK